eukprot:m.4994 g.4994  ORF g.4994 m.4994 type:complete len:333 (-) comp1962_c0_seq1:54-1052(-)
MALLACALLAAVCVAASPDATYSNPVIHGDFPDPGAAYVPATARYWVATTSGDAPNHFAIHSSADLYNWTAEGFVFPSGTAGAPAWAASDYWAPELHIVNGQNLVYFVARNKKNMLSVGAAVSRKGVAGPYEDIGQELVTTTHMGMIDPTFYSENGTNYLIWKADANDPAHCPQMNCPTQIYLSPLDTSGTRVLLPEAQWVVLINQSQPWEGPLVEAPWIIKNGGFYYLFYSGNGYNSPKYAIGVARARSLYGPWSKYGNNPVMHTGTNPFYGPGHCSVLQVGGAWWFVYHAWNNDGSGRNVLLDEITFTPDGWPAVRSPSVQPQPAPATGL